MNATTGSVNQFDTFGSADSPFLPTIRGATSYDFLKNYNYILESPNNRETLFKSLIEVSSKNSSETLHPIEPNELGNLLPKHIFAQSSLVPYSHTFHLLQRNPIVGSRFDCSLSPVISNCNLKRQRSEKRPIPEEQKDDKYFERRRRNNQAAKKSRDARKMREDQIALKATILEHENAILRAQVSTLRQEASSLRNMLLHRKPYEISTQEVPLCVISQ
ncbi:hypothetical protein ABEB36_005217 [Hypothenemus hampei]|uniref:BZIP domain-containing protein n=1 Tax=Hypothenemus hampei TaxID=57062 RepID=A0ABD1F0F9_HYPHA